jgi:hypothetical protein
VGVYGVRGTDGLQMLKRGLARITKNRDGSIAAVAVVVVYPIVFAEP